MLLSMFCFFPLSFLRPLTIYSFFYSSIHLFIVCLFIFLFFFIYFLYVWKSLSVVWVCMEQDVYVCVITGMHVGGEGLSHMYGGKHHMDVMSHSGSMKYWDTEISLLFLFSLSQFPSIYAYMYPKPAFLCFPSTHKMCICWTSSQKKIYYTKKRNLGNSSLSPPPSPVHWTYTP